MGSYSKALQSTLYKQGRSVNWLSQASGVSFGTIAGIIYKDRIPRIDTALKIAEALDMSVEELYLNDELRAPKEKQDRVDSVDTKGAKFKDIRDTLERSKIGILTAIQDIDKELENYSAGYGSGAPGITEGNRELQPFVGPEEAQNYAHAKLVLAENSASGYTGAEKVQIPFIENLAAGNPRAMDYEQKTLPVEKSQLPKGSSAATLVAFKLEGNSMVKVGFHDTDIVLVDQNLPAKDNDLVMAYVDAFDGCTFKRLSVSHFRGEDGKHRKEYLLVWEDGSQKTHTIDPIDDAVIGVYVGRITKQ